MFDRYTERLDAQFQKRKYAILENLCFPEFLSYYYGGKVKHELRVASYEFRHTRYKF